MLSLLVLAGGLFSWSVGILTTLEEWGASAAFFGQSTWQSLVIALGGQLQASDDGGIFGAAFDEPSMVLLPAAGVGLALWGVGAWLAARWSGEHVGKVASTWALTGGRWLMLLLPWSQGKLLGFLLGADWLVIILEASNVFLWGIVLGLVASEWWKLTGAGTKPGLERPAAVTETRARALIWTAFTIYSIVYVAMNWGLWFNMRIPHGDSAMYEEHLWNVSHGKGFRSYLDQGLFLGEHIQVIHLLLLPVYLIWPSHLLLELCQSLALAATIFPVYSIARRHTGLPLVSAVVGVMALLYFPLHYLDISIDVKTFRPTALAIPVVLAAIDACEAKRYRRMLCWVLLGLSAQEDFSIVFGTLGLWMAWNGWRASNRQGLRWGLGLLFGSAMYLLLVMKVLLPYFREGVTIHYASYFAKFGQTPAEILITMITRPLLVVASLATVETWMWGLCLLVPLGGLPLLSPSRLATAAPLFLLLCLNELAQQPPGPFHHFHAPIVPLILWATAAGVGKLVRAREIPAEGFKTDAQPKLATEEDSRPRWGWPAIGPTLALSVTCTVWTGACFSQHPWTFRFWDAGRSEYWRDRYLPGERPHQWIKIADTFPLESNVASTDFVHPRLTHHRRSYDYSDYRRKVAGNTTEVPDDTDFIVIDTRHPYSRVKGPEDVRELQAEPQKWELMPDQTKGYFLVLRRKP